MRASDFVLVLPATYVVLALRAVLPLVLAPATVFSLLAGIFAVVGAPFIARGVRAIVRVRAAARLRRGRHVAWRRPRPRCSFVHLLPAARGFMVGRSSRCSCPRSSSPKRRCRTSASDSPIRSRAGARCCTTRRTSASFADFPWLLSPAAAMFLVVLGLNLLLAATDVAQVALAHRRSPARSRTIGVTIVKSERAMTHWCLRAPADAVRSRRRVDVARLRAALARWVASPLAGFVVLGSNGEAVLLDDAEADRVIAAARDAGARRRPFIVGTGRESTSRTVRAAKRAASLGADAVLVRTPGFFKPQMTADVFVRHYTAVADASPVPVLLYNFTALTGVTLLPDAVSRLASHPNIIGMKESGGDIARIADLVVIVAGRFSVLAGSAGTFLRGALRGRDRRHSRAGARRARRVRAGCSNWRARAGTTRRGRSRSSCCRWRGCSDRSTVCRESRRR